MKSARIFDVRRDGAINQDPLENAAYTGFLLVLELLAFLGIGMAVTVRPGTARRLAVMRLGNARPMVVFFSLDRTRLPLHFLFAIYAAFGISRLIDSFDGARTIVQA